MAYSIRTRYYLQHNNGLSDSNDYIKQLYIKNKNWDPPPATNTIEDSITSFEKLLKSEHSKLTMKHRKTTLSNLTSLQAKTLKELKDNNSIIIKPTDKNLGPAILNREDYIKQILQEHLLSNDYRQLTQIEANSKMETLKNTLKSTINNNLHLLSKAEITYFKRSLLIQHRLPVFYGLPKVHKTPMSLRPVVSCINSLLSVFSTWLDFKMKALLPLIQSYTKNSTAVIQDLKSLHLPENVLIFTADAKSMYTNIDTTTGVNTFKEFLVENADKLPKDFPTSLFLHILEIVMRNNIFSFGETYWLQLTGTAMGTPAACNYATITFGHYENSTLLPAFKDNIIYYRRYIDDIITIWQPPTHDNATIWADFVRQLNGWGTLQWTIEKPSSSTTFLDLQISIINQRIHFSTFQKPLNLYLYLPPLSAHPTSCLKGLLKGELYRYWTQNDPIHFKLLVTKFIERLHARGHSLTNLTPLLTQAAASLVNNKTQEVSAKDSDHDTLFIHWVHHPKGLSGNDIRRCYKQTLEPHLNYNRMIVAISRPKNLKDALTRATLTLPNGSTVQQFITDKI
jgi:hypothetical protein